MRWFAGDQTLVRIGEDAHKGALIASQRKKTVLVVMVGEASRAANYSLNGYPRETNPELKKAGCHQLPAGLLLWHGNRCFRPLHVLRHDAEKI